MSRRKGGSIDGDSNDSGGGIGILRISGLPGAEKQERGKAFGLQLRRLLLILRLRLQLCGWENREYGKKTVKNCEELWKTHRFKWILP